MTEYIVTAEYVVTRELIVTLNEGETDAMDPSNWDEIVDETDTGASLSDVVEAKPNV